MPSQLLVAQAAVFVLELVAVSCGGEAGGRGGAAARASCGFQW